MSQMKPKDVENLRREYGLYTLSNRCMPSIADGLKTVQRRIIWKAIDGKVIKTANLAGKVIAIHPHDECSDSISRLAAPYLNNICLLKGHGAFGTCIEPNEFAASRYTHVELSDLCEELFLVDSDVVEMQDNYDHSEQEPVCFYPLLPMVLINPHRGLNLGYKINILPRDPIQVIDNQISYLKNGNVTNIDVKYLPYNIIATPLGDGRYEIKGEVQQVKRNKFVITNVPPQITHVQVMEHVETLKRNKQLIAFIDRSGENYNIEVTLSMEQYNHWTEGELDLVELFKLKTTTKELLSCIDFDGSKVLSVTPSEIIARFCDWRLTIYEKRLDHQLAIKNEQLNNVVDVITAIESRFNEERFDDRPAMKTWLAGLTPQIIDVDRICDMPLSGFTKTALIDQQKRRDVVVDDISKIHSIRNDPSAIKKLYIKELTKVRKTLVDFVT